MVNREHKDRLFKMIFWREEHRERRASGLAVLKAIDEMPEDYLIRSFLLAKEKVFTSLQKEHLLV